MILSGLIERMHKLKPPCLLNMSIILWLQYSNKYFLLPQFLNNLKVTAEVSETNRACRVLLDRKKALLSPELILF